MKKDTLYKAFLNDKKKKEKEKKIIKEYNLSSDKETIVINKSSSKFIKIISFIIDISTKIIKLITIAIIVILTTIGATVILNQDLLSHMLKSIEG